ncbi:ComF family protein [Lactobacillus acidophilus]|uniref:ComF family protein n=1 Tax=Lactobacillus acidophilus TaxID=1579 RepID=UPI0021A481A3|nr:ComF family protein [Lactobacillus acidophilus]MCT3601659.1 ComF family protein [Lactobacillus acidophilus]MCT3622993.1 ComF family protein [Lactobacillus acidophilus]
MKQCLLCNQFFTPPVLFTQIFRLKKYRERKLCSYCLKQFEHLIGNKCAFCSKVLKQGVICVDCKNWQKKYSNNLLHNYALYHYNSTFHDLMVDYKRRGDYALREVLQELCYEYLHKTKYDYYVPIPTSPEHIKKRQFDTIFAIYGDILPLTPILIKKEGSHAQGKKNREERLKTPQSFLIDKNIKKRENIQTGKVLILDDIYTTGRTLYHARDCLRQDFPDLQIESFSICR